MWRSCADLGWWSAAEDRGLLTTNARAVRIEWARDTARSSADPAFELARGNRRAPQHFRIRVRAP